MPLGNLQIHVCSNLSSCSRCSVVSYYSQGAGAFGELKIHVLHISLLIIAMISPYSKRGGRLLGNTRFMAFFSSWFYFWYCSHDYSHSHKDGNSRLLFLQLVIPKFGGNSDSWSLWCLWGVPDSCFSISSFLKLGNFRLIVSLTLLLQVFSVFGSTRII